MMKHLIILCFIFSIGLQNFAFGQCSSNEHSTNSNDSWKSCSTSESPNPIRGNSHWILYDLGYVYSLGTSHFWNYNVSGETNSGFKTIAIDYSIDGNNWTELETVELSEASGANDYTGEEGPNFSDLDARYVLITALDTWGDGNCAGLSEVRFDVFGIVNSESLDLSTIRVQLFPNPTSHVLNIDLEGFSGKEMILLDIMGHEIIRQNFTSIIDISHLPSGTYLLKILNEKQLQVGQQFIKQ